MKVINSDDDRVEVTKIFQKLVNLFRSDFYIFLLNGSYG
jgi:hypothetical protein